MYEPEISISRCRQYRLFCLEWLSVKRLHLRWIFSVRFHWAGWCSC